MEPCYRLLARYIDISDKCSSSGERIAGVISAEGDLGILMVNHLLYLCLFRKKYPESIYILEVVC